MCERYGRIDAIKIYYDPQTKKHAGKGRVTFATTSAAKLAVSKLDHTSVMGNIIKAQIDPNIKGNFWLLFLLLTNTHGLWLSWVFSTSNVWPTYVCVLLFSMTVVHFVQQVHYGKLFDEQSLELHRVDMLIILHFIIKTHTRGHPKAAKLIQVLNKMLFTTGGQSRWFFWRRLSSNMWSPLY